MPDILFVHRNFPGQFVHIARALARRPDWRVFAVGGEGARAPAGVSLERYVCTSEDLARLDPPARRAVLEHRRGEAVAQACLDLRSQGCEPAFVMGHAGWGEMLFVRDVFPHAKIASYLEFYFRYEGADVNFDPEFPSTGLAAQARVRSRNAPTLFAAESSDILLTPTEWQASGFPPDLRQRLTILHEGIDTARAAPHPGVALDVPGVGLLTTEDEVLTFAARNLEPYRGFHVFMRALPAILASRPRCRVLVLGGDGTSYGQAPRGHGSWRERMMLELGEAIDWSRVHVLGQVAYDVFLGAMQLSRAHVYLTYPFVLSWSVLEAMACGAPVIGSRTGPVEEVIRHGENGWLVDFFDADELAQTVAGVLAGGEAVAEVRRNARRSIVERYDLETVCLPAALGLVAASTSQGA